MAFPQNWIYDVYDADPRNVTPCWIDIVGSYGRDIDAAAHQKDDTYLYFQMRLNKDPRTDPNTLSLNVWGVQIKDLNEDILFTVRVNGVSAQIEVIDAEGKVISESVNIGENVIVIPAGADFGCNETSPDQDSYLVFKVLKEDFSFDFDTEIYKFCYYTSTNAEEIDGEGQGPRVPDKPFLCGPLIYPSIPVIYIVKTMESAEPEDIMVGQEGTWQLSITVTNPPENNEALDISIEDQIYEYEDMEIISMEYIPNVESDASYDEDTRTIIWDNFRLEPEDTATLLITLSGIFSQSGEKVLNYGSGIGISDTGQETPIENFDVLPIYVSGAINPVIDITKTIVSIDPWYINVGDEVTYELKIEVRNESEDEEPVDVSVTDVINAEIEDYTISLNPESGDADYSGKDITWNITGLAREETTTLYITLTGVFSQSGHKILDEGYGIANELPITRVNFQDTGVDIHEVIEITKTIVSADPEEIYVGHPGTWELKIEVINLRFGVPVPVDVLVTDVINAEIEDYTISLNPEFGDADYSGKDITWNITGLNSYQTATLNITLGGKFSQSGHKILNEGHGVADESSATGVDFKDHGIYVKPEIDITKTIVSADPEEIYVGDDGEWKLKIEVTNLEQNSEPVDVIVQDSINAEIEDYTVELEPGSGVATVSDRDIKWNIRGLPIGTTATLDITLKGKFSHPGYKILNEGHGEGFGVLTRVPTNRKYFQDEGINVKGIIDITKTIVSAVPEEIYVGDIGEWNLRIEVINVSENDETVDVEVTDVINAEIQDFNIDVDPSVATVTDRVITWNIADLPKGEAEILDITLTGVFLQSGLKILNEGYGVANNLPETRLDFQDDGIDVKGFIDITKTIVRAEPEKIYEGDYGEWILKIEAKNLLKNNEPLDVSLTDVINAEIEDYSIEVYTGPEEEPSSEMDITWNITGKVITCNIRGLSKEEPAIIYINLKGKFSQSGLKILNEGYGEATKLPLNRVDFEDTGIFVEKYPVIDITKTIVRAEPEEVQVGEKGTWELKIEVTNLSEIDENIDVFVQDHINDEIQDFTVDVDTSDATVEDKDITWIIRALAKGQTATLDITLKGVFLQSGLKILNEGYGVANNTRLDSVKRVEFEDSGITVTDQTFLNVSSIIEGPDEIDVNTEGTWDIIITVENTALANLARTASTRAVVSDIQVINEVISNLRITGTVSDPAASVAGQIVTWGIPQLEAEESKTLIITVTGSFSTEGTTGPLCIGTLAASGMETIEFLDNGIIVIQQVSPTRGIDLFAVIE